MSDQAWKVAGVGDFDGDGRMDILWRNTSTGANQIWKSGNSATQQSVGTQADLNWKAVAVGDYDGDGKADILWRNATTGADVIWRGGDSANQQAVASQVGAAWTVIEPSDGDPAVSAALPVNDPAHNPAPIALDPVTGYF